MLEMHREVDLKRWANAELYTTLLTMHMQDGDCMYPVVICHIACARP